VHHALSPFGLTAARGSPLTQLSVPVKGCHVLGAGLKCSESWVLTRWLTRSGTRYEDGRAIREPPKATSASISTSRRLNVLTAGVAQLQAQAPPAAANTTRNAVFVITLQTITDQARYEKEFQQQATKTIKDAGGRFVVRNDQVTSLAGEAPKRIVITGWESLDDVKKWQAGEYKSLLATRDQVMKVQQFAVYTCENPQGAKPGQTKCP
jgi:uncharacterized protein (DUF1330 family)